MDAEELRLLATYGACQVCGAPRHTVTHEWRSAQGWRYLNHRIACTADETHSQEPLLADAGDDLRPEDAEAYPVGSVKWMAATEADVDALRDRMRGK